MSATKQEKSTQSTSPKTSPKLDTFYVPEYGVSVKAATLDEAIQKAKSSKRNKEEQK